MRGIRSIAGACHSWAGPLVSFLLVAGGATAAPNVEFDFPRAAECRDVTPADRFAMYPSQRLVELVLPVSVRFHELTMEEVEEIDIEISGALSGLRVYDFAPATQLVTDITNEIEKTTTKQRARSLDGTLGGGLPVPYAELVAHVSPSISAGMSSGQTTTEKLKRLPPKYAVIVSGTSDEGRGVFYKFKRTTQTSLEGLHELAVTFVAPIGWRGGEVTVRTHARGQRKLLWIKQASTVGSEAGVVRLYLKPGGRYRRTAKPVVQATAEGPASASAEVQKASAEVARMVDEAQPKATSDSEAEPPAVTAAKSAE